MWEDLLEIFFGLIVAIIEYYLSKPSYGNLSTYMTSKNSNKCNEMVQVINDACKYKKGTKERKEGLSKIEQHYLSCGNCNLHPLLHEPISTNSLR